MIFIVTALRCEAAPFIRMYSMKMISSKGSFSVYGAEGVRLIITGTGGPSAICATTYLLTSSGASKDDVLINCGCSGLVAGDRACVGKMFNIRSLKDEAFGRTFYPDMLKGFPFPEADLMTVTEVRTAPPAAGPREVPMLADMEGAYVYQAASRFIYAHNIHILKLVSDSGSDAINLRPEDIERSLGTEVVCIPDLLHATSVPKDLMLSAYQSNELRKLVASYAVRHDDIDDVIAEFTAIKVRNRREGKAVYARLREKLLKP